MYLNPTRVHTLGFYLHSEEDDFADRPFSTACELSGDWQLCYVNLIDNSTERC